MFRKSSDQATRELKQAIVQAGAITDPAGMTDDDIARVAQAATNARAAIDAEDGDVIGAIARNS